MNGEIAIYTPSTITKTESKLLNLLNVMYVYLVSRIMYDASSAKVRFVVKL